MLLLMISYLTVERQVQWYCTIFGCYFDRSYLRQSNHDYGCPDQILTSDIGLISTKNKQKSQKQSILLQRFSPTLLGDRGSNSADLILHGLSRCYTFKSKTIPTFYPRISTDTEIDPTLARYGWYMLSQIILWECGDFKRNCE